MVSNRVKVVGAGAAIIIIGFLLPAALNFFLGGTEINLASGIPYILITGIFLILSAFFPPTFAKVFRNIAYLSLFIFILIIELQALKPFMKVSQVNIEQCKSLFFPQVKESVSNVIIDALGILSCILTGYFPQEESILGWFIFLLFYIILPFVFIFVLILGLMRSIFESILDKKILDVLSFIIAVYAARVMFGVFLLQFLGYSAWGVAGIFGAVLIVGGVRKIIEDWFRIDAYAEEIKKYYEMRKTGKQLFAEHALRILNDIKKLIKKAKEELPKTKAEEYQRKKEAIDNDIIANIEIIKNSYFYKSLNDEEKNVIKEDLEKIAQFVREGKYDIAEQYLEGLMKLLETWK